jgi:hypothetical protein
MALEEGKGNGGRVVLKLQEDNATSKIAPNI